MKIKKIKKNKKLETRLGFDLGSTAPPAPLRTAVVATRALPIGCGSSSPHQVSSLPDPVVLEALCLPKLHVLLAAGSGHLARAAVGGEGGRRGNAVGSMAGEGGAPPPQRKPMCHHRCALSP